MATLLEGATGLLGFILPFFIAIFVFAIMFAFLDKTKIFGDNQDRGRNAIISIVAGFMVLAIPNLTRLILIVVPWFFFIFLFVLLVDMGFMFLGGDSNGILKNILTEQGAGWFFVVIGAIIVALAAGHVFGQKLLVSGTGNNVTATNVTAGDTATASYQQNLGNTLFHPAVIGMFSFLVIATFAILFLSTADPH